MDIQDWGAIGELIGSVGVLITLVYLAIQLKQNTAMLETTARQNASNIGRETAIYASSNEELIRMQTKFYKGEELSDSDKVLLSWWLVALYRTGETYYMQWEDGLVSDEFWNSRREGLKLAFNLDVKGEIWKQFRSQFLPQYAEIVDAIFEETKFVDRRGQGVFPNGV